jgi:hypothetical protein
VDKIIEGAKLMDLQVEHTFPNVRQFQTAKSLGLTIQPTVLILADQAIE